LDVITRGGGVSLKTPLRNNIICVYNCSCIGIAVIIIIIIIIIHRATVVGVKGPGKVPKAPEEEILRPKPKGLCVSAIN